MDLCDNSSFLFWSHARKQLLPKFLATNQSVSHKAHTQHSVQLTALNSYLIYGLQLDPQPKNDY